MRWNNHNREMKDGDHAFLSPSTYSWLNYSDEKLFQTYINKLASARGTAIHALAKDLIKMRILLPDSKQTLNMYVNDAIRLKMEPEVKLYYSKFCFGTADCIGVKDGVIRVWDLKTGKIKASFQQLKIYLALFFLEYPEYKPGKMEEMEIRIYQSDEIRTEHPETDEIVPIMDRIVRYSKFLDGLEERYNDGGIDARWGGS